MQRIATALQQQGWRIAAASPQMRAHSRAIYRWFPHRKPVKEARHPRYPGIRIAWAVNTVRTSEAYEAIMRVTYVTGRQERWGLDFAGWLGTKGINLHGLADADRPVDAYRRLLQSTCHLALPIMRADSTVAAAERMVSLSVSFAEEFTNQVPNPIGILEFWASEIIRIERAHTASAPVGAAQRVA